MRRPEFPAMNQSLHAGGSVRRFREPTAPTRPGAAAPATAARSAAGVREGASACAA